MSKTYKIEGNKIVWDNGDVFEAYNNLPNTDNLDDIFKNVSGTFTWTDGEVFEGTYVNSEMSGYGIFLWEKDLWYNGIWNNGFRDVFGIQQFDYGVYTGEWRNDKMDGDGCIEYHNGDVCAGEFTNGEFNDPNGFFRFANGDEYRGSFLYGFFHGYGVFTYADGRKYEGTWKNGEKEGYGVYYWPDGDIFKGNWKKGKRHGKGLKIKGGIEQEVEFKFGKKLKY